MRLLLLLSFLSFNAFAQSTVAIGTFEKYRGNFQTLQADLAKLEEANVKNPNPLYAQMLKDMSYLKEQYDHIASPLRLDDLYQDAKDNNWANLQKMSKALIPLCESAATYNIALCKNGFEEMRTFAMGSKLSTENKDSLASFIDDYLLQVQAMHTMNTEFIATFNKNAEAISSHVMTAPSKVVVKVQSAPVVAAVELEKPFFYPSALMTIVSDIETSKSIYAAFLVFVIFSFFGVKIYRKNKGEQMVKDFYTKLFTLSKKANIQMKVFGKLSASEANLIKGIQMPFLNSIYLSRAVANKSEVRFKTKKNSIVSIEVNYLSSRSIQNVMSLPKESAFKESMEKLQTSIENVGGEFVICNRFNSFGELIQSSMLIHLPKA